MFSTQKQRIRKRARVFFLACIAVYCTVEVSAALMYLVVPFDYVIAVHGLTTTALAVAIALGFFVLWLMLSSALKAVADPAITEKLRKITFVAILGAVCWLMKAAAALYEVLVLDFNFIKFPNHLW